MNKLLFPVLHLLTVFRSSGTAASLLRGTMGSCVNRVVANGLMFIAQIVFARWLGLEGFGIYALALAWLGVLVMVGRLGFDLATVRFVATYHGANAWPLLRGFLRAGRVTVFGTSLVTGGTLALSAFLLTPAIGPSLANSLVIAGAVLPLLAMVHVEAAALRGLGRVVVGDLPSAIGHPLLLLIGFLGAVALMRVPATPETALLSYLGATAATLAVLRALMARELPAIAEPTVPEFRWREWLTTAPAMMLITGFGVVLNQSSTIIVGTLSGAAAASIFGAASRIASVLQIIVISLIAAISPLAVRLSTSGEFAKLQRAIDVGVTAVFAAAAAATIGLVVFGGWILGLFGAGFVAGYDVLLILVAGQLCAAAVAPAGILLNMTGHQNVSARILAGAAVANLLLCTLSTWAYGLNGAAISTALTTAGLGVAMAVSVHRKLNLRSWVSMAALRLGIVGGATSGRAPLRHETGVR